MSAPDDLSARVSVLERTVAKLEGKLEADLNRIDGSLADIKRDVSNLYALLGEINKTLAALNAHGAVTSQKSTTNEKIIFAVVGTLVSALTFVLGKVLS